MSITLEHVVDTSAIMALILRETGWDVVRDVKRRSTSAVNLAEAVTALINKGYAFDQAVDATAILELTVFDFDERLALESARLRPFTQKFGLSLGDRACLALAAARGVPVLTTDRVWADAAPHVTINVIR